MNKQLDFYKSYHNNIINQWIHFFCIPMIVTSIMIFLKDFYILYDQGKSYKIKLVDILILFYTIGYLNISIKIGFIMFIYFILLDYISGIIVKYNYETIAKYMFLCGWIFQFIGHYIEGKRPALLDSFTQSFFQAPLFSLDVIINLE